MAKKHCGGKRSRGPKTVSVQPHQRSKPGKHCFGSGQARTENGFDKAAPEVAAMSYLGRDCFRKRYAGRR